MKPHLRVVPSLLLALFGCGSSGGPPPAKPPAPPPSTVPADLRAEVAHAEKLGQDIFLQDKAAAIASDVLLANVPSPQDHDLRGYLTMIESDAGRPLRSWIVLFYTGDDPPKIAFRVRVPMDGAAKPGFDVVDPPAPTSEGVQLLIRARQTAIAALPERVQPINPVIVPGDADGVLVYLLAGTKRPGIAVFGKHYRVLVSPDGTQVLTLEPLSKSVLELPVRPRDVPAKYESVGLVVSHVVTDAPIETHVFVSLMHKMPVYVATARGNWKVDGNKISFMSPPKRAAGPKDAQP
jgi:hypothetical protein